jgi:hypothetical protein
MKNKVYIYLAKRDKKGIKILSCFSNLQKYHPVKINDLKQLNLPEQMYKSLNQQILENKMMYEPWIQSSESFNDFRQSLIKRGYSNVPLQQSVSYVIRDVKEKKIDFKSKKNTMLRRNSKN